MNTRTLPRSISVLVTTHGDGRVTAHALDFDIVCEASDHVSATNKLLIALRAYLQYGLANGMADTLLFHAPDEYWLLLERADRPSVSRPANMAVNPLVMFQAMLNEAHRSPCPTI